ncbi:polysaccharide biosynthesis protein [Nioella nitratireducens]|uniref:polysaccharide biosynthesis protein n=1 Tax=Nioella nitratireducens TaxID=1287720 RepID=UPI0008FD3F4E|nr:nucleoside-diphosphate sugar epimerase/dehydratase [Nioella nitratireducens]
MLKLIKTLTRRQKRHILLFLDLCLIPLALVFTFGVQPEPDGPIQILADVLPILPYLLAIGAGLAVGLGIPQIQLNAYEGRALGKTGLFSVYMAVAAAILSWMFGVDLTVGQSVVFGVGFFMFSVISRMALYQIVMAVYRRDIPRCRVLIYGAGTTGTQLASALRSHEGIDPVAFVDDNTALQGVLIAGLPVYTPAKIQQIARERSVRRVLLAIPSLSQPKQAQIARRLQKMGLEVQSLPSFAQLVGEEPLVDKLTPVRPATFLGRAPAVTSLGKSCDSYADRTVLISGAGGSIGSELSRQIVGCRPSRLVLYELSEFALFNIDQELRPLATELGVELVSVLGSVTDPRQVRQVLRENAVQVIIHAAAYKHVSLVEANPIAGLANNVLGTQTLAREAEAINVERFVLVSSDKAVRPASVMGASKRLAELVVQDLAARSSGTIFSMVRFGNVLGSSGSVVPLFQEQISRGGPVTVTDPEVCRFFMTVREAVHLVLLAGATAKGGEVFVLDMGEEVSIARLARQIIESAGYSVRDADNPDGDIEIEFTGLRQGEKLHEELTLSGERVTTSHPKIFCAREDGLSEIEVASAIRGLREAIASGDEGAALAVVDRWVEGRDPADQSTLKSEA